VVALQEINGKTEATVNFPALASAAGYGYTAITEAGSYGSLRVGVMSRYPITFSESWSSAEVSGDALANDVTRELLEAVIDVGGGATLRLLATHWKSGTRNSDEFRRAIESFRMNALAASTPARTGLMLMGDVNHDILDRALSPSAFTSNPSGLPTSFSVGSDVQAEMTGGGLINNPFFYLTGHAAVIDALQLDGNDATRPTSGRRIDYLLANEWIVSRGVAAQVFDCADEALAGSGLARSGPPLAADVCAAAADHLPIIADVEIAPAVQPAFALSAGTLDFGGVLVGDTAPSQVVTLESTGQLPVEITALTLGGDAAADFSAPAACVGTFNPGSTCEITVGFTPTAAGTRTATLVVEAAGEAGSKTVTLTGVGAAAAWSVDPARLSFSRLRSGQSQTLPVTVSNTGTLDLPIEATSLTGDLDAFSIAGNSCGATLSIGAQCTISVRFSPRAKGRYSATLEIVPGAGLQTVSVSISGAAR
ncbi:MAG: choice-of-anchor D domain-containing protein, partial [Steroidobacteraceae bacterium]